MDGVSENNAVSRNRETGVSVIFGEGKLEVERVPYAFRFFLDKLCKKCFNL